MLVEPVDAPEKAQVLPQRATIASISTAQFSESLPYRWKVTLPPQAGERESSGVAFDSSTMNWTDTNVTSWRKLADAKENFASGELSIRAVNEAVWVFRNQEPWVQIPELRLPPSMKLAGFLSVAWCCNVSESLQANKAVVFAVADLNHYDISVYAIQGNPQPRCELLRVFRGHESTIQSLDCSPDHRYLLSAGSDCTIRLWSLLNIEGTGNDRTLSTWGCLFELVDGNIVVTDSSMAGPLYTRGLRDGDLITEVSWEKRIEGGTTERVTYNEPEAILTFLGNADFNNAVRFIYSRGRIETSESKCILIGARSLLRLLRSTENGPCGHLQESTMLPLTETRYSDGK